MFKMDERTSGNDYRVATLTKSYPNYYSNHHAKSWNR